MSYILEALRKAERERNPNQPEAPRLETRQRLPQIPALQRLRPYRPLLVAGLCICLMLAVTVSLILHHFAAPAPVAVATIAQPTPAHAPAAPSDQDAALGDGSGPATLDDLVDSSGAASPDDAVAPVETDPLPRVDNPAPAAAASSAADDAADIALAAQPVQPAQPAAPTTSVQHFQLDAAPPIQVPRLKDMAADYRAAFPAISLDVHSYDNAASRRFIMIAGKRYNEGDVLAEGLRVVQIVPDGVIFEFRGEQTLFPVSR